MWQHPWPADPCYLSSLKPLMAMRSDRQVVSLISDQGHDTFLYRYAKHNRAGGRKEQTNKHGLGSAVSARRGKPMRDFCVAFRVFAGYRGRIIAWNFHKATRNADSSLDCLLCLAFIFSLPPSADCVLLWTYLYLYRLSPRSDWTGFLPSKYSISLFMLLINDMVSFLIGNNYRPIKNVIR